MSLFRVTLALVVCVGCTESPQLGTTSAAVWGFDDGCSWAICGNAAKLFGPFYELDMTGTTPSALGGYRIKKFSKAGVSLKLTVAGFDVIGTTPTNQKLMNDQLVGAVFEIVKVGYGNHVHVTIADVAHTKYFEGGNDSDQLLPTFRLEFQEFGGSEFDEYPIGLPQFVCPTGQYGPHDDLYRHALLFSGTRYSAGGGVTKTGAEAHPWFNVACSDTAQWKAAEFRLVAVAESPAFPSEPNDYSAAVRSIRADYCGNGIAHTVLGTKVDWENRGDWLWKENGLVLEAIWNQDHAVCIGSRPRIDDAWDNLECAIPTCTSRDRETWRQNYLMATWVPAPGPILIAP